MLGKLQQQFVILPWSPHLGDRLSRFLGLFDTVLAIIGHPPRTCLDWQEMVGLFSHALLRAKIITKAQMQSYGVLWLARAVLFAAMRSKGLCRLLLRPAGRPDDGWQGHRAADSVQAYTTNQIINQPSQPASQQPANQPATQPACLSLSRRYSSSSRTRAVCSPRSHSWRGCRQPRQLLSFVLA